MLVFISDLHINDRSAGIQFLNEDAFHRVFREIGEHSRHAGSQSIELIFLGDVFDLVRTTHWFRKEPKYRPWGITDDLSDVEKQERIQEIERNAIEMMNAVTLANEPIFALFSDPGKFTKPTEEGGYGFTVEPQKVYIPGNHDRICNQFASLRSLVANALGLQRNPAVPFPHYYQNARYRTFARHGHEWDPWNNELGGLPPVEEFEKYDWSRYMPVPVGEVIATELASKLAPAVYARLREVNISPEDRRRLADQFKTVDDVRPVAAIIPWLLDRLSAHDDALPPEILEAAKSGVNDVLESFAEIPFVKQWIRTNDTISPIDPPSILKDILFLGRNIPIGLLQRLMPVVQKINELRQTDNLAHNAVTDIHRLDQVADQSEHYLYVLYGHTHRPDQVPIEVTLGDAQPRVYLNTGTWRPRHQQGINGRGFMNWKGISYTMIYDPEHDPGSQASRGPGDYPTFETWTGSLEEHPTVAEEVDEDYPHLH